MLEVMIVTWLAQLNGANVPWWFWAIEVGLAWTEVWSGIRKGARARKAQQEMDAAIADAIRKIEVEIDDGK